MLVTLYRDDHGRCWVRQPARTAWVEIQGPEVTVFALYGPASSW